MQASPLGVDIIRLRAMQRLSPLLTFATNPKAMHPRTFLFPLVVGSAITPAFNQVPPGIQWQKCLGGTDNDWAHSVQRTSDGGYVTIGYAGSNDGDVTGNHGSDDFWVIKLDASGTLQWQKALGGSNTDWAQSIQQTSDGGYIVAGMTTSNNGDVSGNHGDLDMWVAKLDATGSLQWQNTLGGSSDDRGFSAHQTSDGGYIVTGETFSNDGDVTSNHGLYDIWVVKLNASGSLVWQKSFGGSDYDFSFAIQQTDDGGYIVAGGTRSNNGDVSGNHGGLYDFWLAKLDASGTLYWQKALGGSGWDIAQSIQQVGDGYIVAGNTDSNDGDVSGNNGYRDFWVVKVDLTGTLIWQQALGGSGNDNAFEVCPAADGGYVVTGEINSNDGDVSGNHGGQDAWVVKLDAIGSLVWQKAMGGSGEDHGYSIDATSDGGAILGGRTYSNDGDVSGIHGNADFWIVKLQGSPTQGLQEVDDPELVVSINLDQQQAIVTSAVHLDNAALTLIDAMGRCVLHERMNGSEHVLDLRSLRAGLYVLTVGSEQGVSAQRLLIE